ncbi:MAG: ATP-binding protein [Patescibacteria group bacterium]|nr:ATP-binding protein [Patescibacteria group bacterium]
MSTRHEKMPGPLSQERYMSSHEFAELHGISGVAVSSRAAILLHAAKRNLIWFIQGLSLVEGGLRRLAKELVEMFPKRLGEEGSSLALRPHGNSTQHFSQYEIGSASPNLEEFLVDLCINPRLHFALPWKDVDVSDIETDSAIEQHRELSKGDFKQANLNYFQDIVGALFEYKKRYEARARENFQLTTIGKKIWETLDFALASHGMVLLDGLEGRGKTEAVKAWCGLHLGEARFVSLKGITSKTTAFREIAKALGIASSYTRTATEMQARIEDVLKRSKLLLCLDESHFLFNQSRRMYSRPELIDWIDTAIVNCGVGCALVTTPQFIVCMTRAADQVEWNYRQFRRRVKRWVKLPAANTEDDIKAVARNVFKKAPAAALDKIVGYALLSKRDLSAVGDVATEVRAMLGTDDLSKASVEQVRRAIYDFLLPSDKAFLEGMEAARQTGRKSFRKSMRALPAEALQEPQEPPQEESRGARRGIAPLVNGQRRRAENPADLVAA